MCTKTVIHVCTYSFFHIYTNVPTNFSTVEKMSTADCWELVKTGKIGKMTLDRLSKDVWKAAAELEIEYALLGTLCNYTNEFNVVKTVAATIDENSEISSDIGDMSDCKLNNNFCDVAGSTVVWESIPRKKLCKFEPAGDFSAIFAGRYVLIERIQAAFVFNYNEVDHLDLVDCFPPNTYIMENNVFINVHNLSYLIDTGTKFVLPIKPEIFEENNRIEKTNRTKREKVLPKPPSAITRKPVRPPLAPKVSPRKPQLALTQKPANKTILISSQSSSTANNTNNILFETGTIKTSTTRKPQLITVPWASNIGINTSAFVNYNKTSNEIIILHKENRIQTHPTTKRVVTPLTSKPPVVVVTLPASQPPTKRPIVIKAPTTI